MKKINDYFVFLTNFVLFFLIFFIYLKKNMEQNKNINLFLRFIKEENLHTTVIESLKYYCYVQRIENNFYKQIINGSNNGKDAYHFFEWIFRLQILKNNLNLFDNNKKIYKSDEMGFEYSTKWVEFLKKNNYKIV